MNDNEMREYIREARKSNKTRNILLLLITLLSAFMYVQTYLICQLLLVIIDNEDILEIIQMALLR